MSYLKNYWKTAQRVFNDRLRLAQKTTNCEYAIEFLMMAQKERDGIVCASYDRPSTPESRQVLEETQEALKQATIKITEQCAYRKKR